MQAGIGRLSTRTEQMQLTALLSALFVSLCWAGAGAADFASTAAARCLTQESASRQADLTPFRVRDSIEWTHVVSFAASPWSPPTDTALHSPGRSYFVIRTRRGDVTASAVIDSLLVYAARDVRQLLESTAPRSTVQPVRTITVSVAKDEESLLNVHWLSDSELGFIAKGSNGKLQGFAADIRTGAISQLTSSDTDVVAFSSVGASLMYYARTVQEQPKVIVVANQSLGELLPHGEDPDWLDATPLEIFAVSSGRADRGKVAVPARVLIPAFRRFWISPSGRYAVALAPAVNAPPEWASYRIPDYERFGFTPQWVRDDPTSFDLAMRVQYWLVDLHRQVARPLLDAPSGAISYNYAPQEIFWLHDEKSVIAANTYLPLNEVGSSDRARRERQPAIAEIDIGSGAAQPIMWEAVRSESSGQAESTILALRWLAEQQRLVITKRRATDGAISEEAYERTRFGWRSASVKARTSEPTFVVERHEGLNARPVVHVRYRHQPNVESLGASSPKLLLDPNPQADRLLFAETEVRKWKDANGTEWTAGLLLPPDCLRSRPYPLVVQTHGFKPDRFLLDGPAYDGQGGTAFAAQALASAGIAVLQIEDNVAAISRDEREGALVAEGFRSGIAQLVAAGMADPARVGLIGFSRTGYHTLHLLARHPELLKAAVISDSFQNGYVDYLLSAGTTSDVQIQLSRLAGGGPRMSSIAEWFARNPLYSIDKATTAVRLEQMGNPLGLWETFAILRSAMRPVDFILYPVGRHVLTKPAERLASQGGSVDWFRFWLQDYEDPDPEKRSQYTRWRELRKLAP